MSTRSLVFGVAFLFVSSLCAIAGSAAGGGAALGPTDNSSVSTYKVTNTGVGASAQSSAGGSASQGSSSSSTSGSSTDTSSSSGAASSSGVASSNGTASTNSSAPSTFGVGPSGAKSANQTAIELARERVIDTGDKAVETEKPAKTEPRDKTFAPGLLDKVSDISAVGAQKEHGSGSKTDESKSAASGDKNDSHK
ncbi:MAG TPA: hypothetical protein VNW72_05075 [Chthoniobacterales bacterium]|jgi:hypothetical protein|nr:hypothetical protein [Chthoniobacterales bacterium]